MINTALYSSSTDDWATPQDLYNDLDQEFKFNLDPCANHINHKCDKYFTVAEDGLKQCWGGQVLPYFATRRTGDKLRPGSKRLTKKAGAAQRWSYLFPRAPIHAGFTTISTIKPK